MKAKILVAGLLICALASPAVAAETLKEMFTGGSVHGNIQLLNFTRDFDSATPDNQDTAFGGTLYYKTAAFKGISFGTAFAATDVVGDDDEGFYYGLSAPVHESVSRIQEYYLQADFADTQIKIGAQELSTPFLNIHPIRMINRAYRGLSLVNKSIENLTLKGFYLKDQIGWVDEDFISFSDDVYVAGASYKASCPVVDSTLQAWFFTMPDSFRQSWFQVSLNKKMGDYLFHAAPTYFSQQSQGDELDGELDTYQYGLNAGVSAFGFDLTAFYAKTGDDSIRDDWGYGKIIIQQVRNSGDAMAGDRADEEAYAARLSYDFASAGVKGLKGYVMYANYDAPAESIDETDFSLSYNFSGALEGLGLRARYAMVDADNGTDLTDTRFYVTYRF